MQIPRYIFICQTDEACYNEEMMPLFSFLVFGNVGSINEISSLKFYVLIDYNNQFVSFKNK